MGLFSFLNKKKQPVPLEYKTVEFIQEVVLDLTFFLNHNKKCIYSDINKLFTAMYLFACTINTDNTIFEMEDLVFSARYIMTPHTKQISEIHNTDLKPALELMKNLFNNIQSEKVSIEVGIIGADYLNSSNDKQLILLLVTLFDTFDVFMNTGVFMPHNLENAKTINFAE